jgi:hypothetical protein
MPFSYRFFYDSYLAAGNRPACTSILLFHSHFMKILFVTSSNPDNLEDAILHGLRTVYGADCIDYPKKEVMYRNFSARPHTELYGNLFTLWRTLDDIPVDRTDVERRLKKGYYDLVIFGSIDRTQPFYRYYRQWLDRRTTILLDGEDLNRISPAARDFLYFKRELQPKASYYYNYKLIPPAIYNRRALYPNVLPIAFAIPEEKITYGITRDSKTRMFPSHVVDRELAEHPALQGERSTGFLFTEEEDYYADLRAARFGITMKRGGWDCLRHYEIAANGGVICFRDLDSKPKENAPHGLDAGNSINYSSANELLGRLDKLRDDQYDTLLRGGYEWIAQQTTEVRAREMIDRAFHRFRS